MNFAFITSWLEKFSSIVPIEIFAFVGTFAEEIIAPIPSPFVMMLTGSLAYLSELSLARIIFLIFIAAVGKTLASWILYLVADKLEDVLVQKFGKFFGINQGQIEALGNKLSKGWKDDLLIILARAFPIIPSAPVSIACGILAVNIRSFLLGTFIGTLFRNTAFFYLGYLGLENFDGITGGGGSTLGLTEWVIFIVLALIIGFSYYKQVFSKMD